MKEVDTKFLVATQATHAVKQGVQEDTLICAAKLQTKDL